MRQRSRSVDRQESTTTARGGVESIEGGVMKGIEGSPGSATVLRNHGQGVMFVLPAPLVLGAMDGE